MSQAVATQNSAASLTGLLVPLADRTLLLPNVAVAVNPGIPPAVGRVPAVGKVDPGLPPAIIMR